MAGAAAPCCSAWPPCPSPPRHWPNRASARSASLTQLTVRGNTDKVLELARVFKTERSKLYHAAPTKPQAAPKPALHNLDDSELNNHSISARARL